MWSKARLVDETITGGSNFSESTTQHKLVVPAGKRYKILTISIDNDVSSTITIRAMSAGDSMFQLPISESATVAKISWPENAVNTSYAWDGVLGPGEYMQYDFGTAQTAAGEIMTRYVEVSL